MIREAAVEALGRYTRALEASVELIDRFVSFDDELFDGTGRQVWSKISLEDFRQGSSALAYRDQEGLEKVRNHGRYLALENEFAINGHENRVSYVVGSGHVYSVKPQPGEELDPLVCEEVKAVIDDFVDLNNWHQRQQEIMRRCDRDGESFLRFFPSGDGLLRVRFVEPEQIRNLQAEKNDAARFGIIFNPNDAEEPEAYIVHALGRSEAVEEIPAVQIQHRKANVDCTSPRGLPLYYPVRTNLARAEKLLANMSTMAGIRAAFALIRKHASGAQSVVQNFLDAGADVQTSNSTTGKTTNYREYPPGSIIDSSAALEHEFPAHNTGAGELVTILQAELRAIASRLTMPEFMLSSDASNANYASTMVAEGPAVKMFERLQAQMIHDDLEVLRLAVRTAAAAGKLEDDVLERVTITVEPPQVRTRDRLKEVQADQVLVLNSVMSHSTMAARHGLDYDAEREAMDEEAEDNQDAGGLDLGKTTDNEPEE